MTFCNENKLIKEYDDNVHFNLIYSKYKLYGLNMFRYENLPHTIEQRYIEKGLYENGEVAFYNDKSIGLICLPCSGSGNYNYQGEPIGVVITPYSGDTIIENDDKNFVRLKNNDESIATRVFVDYYARKMFEVERAIEANVKQQKFPFLFVTDDKTVTAMKTVYNKIMNGEFAIFSGKNIDLQNNVNVLNTNVPYVVDKLNQYRYELEREILTFFGLNNNFEKKERLLTDEVNSNNDYVNTMIDIMYKERKKAIEEVNKKFGTNIKVYKVNGINNVSRETLNNKEE